MFILILIAQTSRILWHAAGDRICILEISKRLEATRTALSLLHLISIRLLLSLKLL